MRCLLGLLMLAACGSGAAPEPRNDASVELPQPSGPPVVQQVDNQASIPATAEPGSAK